MKKIVLATLAAMALSSSVMALDLVDENENLIFRIGADLEGTQNDAKDVVLDSDGNPTCNGACGKLGKDKDMGFEISFGTEEKVNDGEFGSRNIINLYNHGDAEIHNGGLVTDTTNMGVEATYELFYSLNKYFKPYIGAGAGINRQTVDYTARGDSGGAFMPDMTRDREKEVYEPTLHVLAGISGDIYEGLGYYVSAKYRFADTSTTIMPFRQEGNIVSKTIEITGVNGEEYMIGLSYRF